MRRKLILKTVACLLMLGGCAALTTCTKQKPNVLQTQQVRRAIDNFDTITNGVVDIDLSYLNIFYFMPLNRNTLSSIDIEIETNEDTYNLTINLNDLSYSQKEYFIIAFYNIKDIPTTPVSADNYNYAIYSYSLLNDTITYINNYTINDNTLQYENWQDLYIYNFNGFIGVYYDNYNYFETTQNALNEINSLVAYKAPSFVNDLNNTITALQIDYRDAMRENQALQTIIDSRDATIEDLNERIDTLNNEIARQEAAIDNLQELNNLPTHLGGWMQLVINLLQNLWNMELLPHVKLGYFVALPILFTLVSLIIKLVRGA